MHILKTIMAALLLVSILPLCGLATAWEVTGNIDGDVFVLDEAPNMQESDVSETTFDTPLKSKRVAVLQQAHCGVNAPFPSETDHLLFSSGNVEWVLGNPNFTPRCAQAPPTSPPRSV